METREGGISIDRRELGVRFLQFAAALGIGASRLHAAELKTRRGPHKIVVERDISLLTRDKVALATDIYRPAGNDGKPLPGQFPVILERTPYGKSQATTRHASTEVAEVLASHGYVVIYQDCRGRGKSGGEYVKYLSDGNDGFDCCAWIVAQPWSNGRIGTMGLSYAAHTQAALASAGAPGVVAMFMDSGGFSNAFQGGIRQGGAFELKQATWAFSEAVDAPDVRNDPVKLSALKAVDIKAWFANMPWKRGNSPLSLVPEYEDYVFDQWERGTFDDYWQQLGIYAAGYYDRFADVAVTMMSSWYDPYPRTVTENYLGLKARGRGVQRLVLGPWTHGNRELTYSGNVDFGTAATFSGNVSTSYLDFKLDWFNRHLKAEDRIGSVDPEVQLFVMGGGSGRRRSDGRMDHGGKWRAERSWPIERTRAAPYYLHADGRLSPDQPRIAKSAKTFLYDPQHPVPTIGGTVTSGQPVMIGGAFDQREGSDFFGSRMPYRPLSERPDILVFQTEPLLTDVEVTGPVEATLWVSSDCPDTDLTIKLIDLYPPNADYPEGYAMNVTDGILRCRYRRSWSRPSLMQPGKFYKVRVAAFPTSNLFAAGHRIRLDISSSNFPHFDLNPNTGEPEGRPSEFRIATNRVAMDRKRPSHVILPIITAV